MTYRLRQQIDWLGLRFAVPEDWQIVRHGLDPRAGRLVLVDRRRERFTLGWTALASAPDLGQVGEDYGSRLAVAQGGARSCPLVGVEGWVGAQAEQAEGRIVTRAARWDERGGRLLEAVILTQADSSAEDALLRALLENVTGIEPGADARRFRAFDLDVQLPEGFGLVGLEARPAAVRLAFRCRDPRGRGAEATLQRWGMSDAWHDGDLEHLLRREAPKVRFVQVERRVQGGVQELCATGREATTPWQRLWRSAREHRVRLWSAPAENAVYCLSTKSHRLAPVLPDDFSLRGREEAA